MKYDIYAYVLNNLEKIEKGVYLVKSTNATYDTRPTKVIVDYNGNAVELEVSKPSWGYIHTEAILVYNPDVLEYLDSVKGMEDQEVLDHLDGLRPHNMSVEDFINDDEIGFSGDAKAALRACILNDADAMPLSDKELQNMMVKAMTNR